MELNNISTYFPIDFRGRSKIGACFHIYPESVFTKKQCDEIKAATDRVWVDGLYTNTGVWINGSYSNDEWYTHIVTIGVDLSNLPKKSHNEILESIIKELNNVAGIKKIIINDGSIITNDEEKKSKLYGESEESDLDEALGLTKLDLSYIAHAEGIEGECFNYSVYFTDDTADELKANAVRNALSSFDFELIDDDYNGYMDVSVENNKVLIYLDLGNVEPQNENKIIYGVLLALNNVQGIKMVIIN